MKNPSFHLNRCLQCIVWDPLQFDKFPPLSEDAVSTVCVRIYQIELIFYLRLSCSHPPNHPPHTICHTVLHHVTQCFPSFRCMLPFKRKITLNNRHVKIELKKILIYASMQSDHCQEEMCTTLLLS